MTAREKELSAVGISVAAGCKPCTNYHVKAAREAGASDKEIARAVEVAASVRARAAGIMRNHALSRLAGFERVPDWDFPVGDTDRVKQLVSIGAAFGVNCVSTLEKHLEAAATAGISREEITELVRLAMMVKERAASHVERLWAVEKEEEQAESALAH
jgi:AhpD family alkylhydroperoxidase